MLTHRLTRTSTFRLTACLGLVSGLAILVLLGLVYAQTAGVLSRRVDHILNTEAAALARLPPSKLLNLIRDGAVREPLSDVTVYARSGQRIAGRGRLAPSDLPTDGTPRDFEGPGAPPRRAIAVPLQDGNVLIVERDTSQLVEVRRIIIEALLWSGGGVVALVGALAVALSIPALRRITETRAASEAIAAGDFAVRLPVSRRYDELDDLALIVNAMMDEIERLVTDARTVGEGVAHELRTPLTRLRATLDHAADAFDVSDPRRTLLETCIAETDALLSRFRALLRIAAVESGSRRTAIRPMSLTSVVAQAVELFEPVAAHGAITLRADIAEGVEIAGDAELLFEALSNLLDNAIKFSPAHSTVCVTLLDEKVGPKVLVSDQGRGIDAKDMPFLTKKFYRGVEAANIPGHGLGLSLVAAVVNLHGFTLDFLEARPGTTVRIDCATAWASPVPTRSRPSH